MNLFRFAGVLRTACTVALVAALIGNVGVAAAGNKYPKIKISNTGDLPKKYKFDIPRTARFLSMATFGATEESVAEFQELGVDGWFEKQFSAEPSLHYPLMPLDPNRPNTPAARMAAWWLNSLTGQDQLRQRVAFAWSELFVVSDKGNVPPLGVAAYQDLLLTHAFSNFRDLLEQVTLSPAMGRYLSMLGNQKGDEAKGTFPDENYAREVMQLFTIGLVKVNKDGSVKLDKNGEPVSSYTQQDVEALARVFTGWTYADATSFGSTTQNWTEPMQAWPSYHDTGEKTLFKDIVLPSGQSPEADLKMALDALFEHKNTPSFVASHLIRRLVTSNPSADYIKRVAKVFIDNGAGVRGDIQAVTRAVLLDAEALYGAELNPAFGKMREPLLAMTSLWRYTHARSISGVMGFYWPEGSIGQAPLSAATVFNFFSPDYAPIGELMDAGMVAPEFELHEDSLAPKYFNYLQGSLTWRYWGNPSMDEYPDYILTDLGRVKTLADDPATLVDELSTYLVGGNMPAAYRDQVLDYLNSLNLSSSPDPKLKLCQEAMSLILQSPYFMIQH